MYSKAFEFFPGVSWLELRVKTVFFIVYWVLGVKTLLFSVSGGQTVLFIMFWGSNFIVYSVFGVKTVLFKVYWGSNWGLKLEVRTSKV